MERYHWSLSQVAELDDLDPQFGKELAARLAAEAEIVEKRERDHKRRTGGKR